MFNDMLYTELPWKIQFLFRLVLQYEEFEIFMQTIPQQKENTFKKRDSKKNNDKKKTINKT